jgi:hypothetical protein
MTRLCHILAVLVAFVGMSQGAARTDSLGTLRIISEPSGADVYIDTLYVGKTPLHSIPLPDGFHRVRLYYPSVMAWNAITREDSVTLVSRRETEKFVELGTVATIQSVPSGGTVNYHGTDLGLTPLYLSSLTRLSGDLLIQKEGFEPQRVALGEREGKALIAVLHPKQRSIGLPSDEVSLYDQQAVSPQSWPFYVAGSTMIVSGVLSAYLKDQANREFDRHLQSGDPAALSATRRLDRAAAISLAVSQVSFLVLSYLLLSD